MDQKNLILAIALSIAILLGFQLVFPPHKPVPQAQAPAPAAEQTPGAQPPQVTAGAVPGAPATAAPAAPAVPAQVPRLTIEGPRVTGSISLIGARIDDIRLNDFRETIDRNSPNVAVLTPWVTPQPYWAQFGWTAPAGVRVPDNDTVWTASATSLRPDAPVTLSWDNGAGLRFEQVLTLEPDFLISVTQRVVNGTGAAVQLTPWGRVRREYLPHTAGFYILHEGLVGVIDGRLQEFSYANTRDEGARRNGLAFEGQSVGGWAGFTDKYWLSALIPDQETIRSSFAYRHVQVGGRDQFQVDIAKPETAATQAGATLESGFRLFAGAKEVRTLDRIRDQHGVRDFDKAIDFGWFYFLTKPFFYAIDWLFHLTGNFGVAILIFTLIVKILFFPLANKSYKSMSKMKLLAPKMQELKERYGGEPAKMQQEMMAMYRAEKINPAAGCLPILIQIPVFFALYKVLFVTIEMRHAPFFGWIRDLSAPDPTNVFNLFGLIPFDPAAHVSLLHLGVWPLLMGFTMWLQMKLNPTPPDPIQAKVFAFMPFIFTFMLASFPAGLVIYWTWNNLLSIGQQWLIMRQTAAEKAAAKPGAKAKA